MACCKCLEHEWEDPQESVYTDGEGKEYCVFHAPKEHTRMRVAEFDESVAKFNEKVFERIQAYDHRKMLICNFSGTIFPGKISFSQFTEKNPLPRICFDSCMFKCTTEFKSVKFSDTAYFRKAIFSEDVYFSSANFEFNAEFNNAEFNGFISFKLAKFNSRKTLLATHFNFAKFLGPAFFKSATFNALVSFRSARFIESIDFDECKFNCPAFFYDANFYKNLSIKSSSFNSTASFSSVSFIGKASFDSSMFWGNLFFNRAIFYKSIIFRLTTFCLEINFKETTLRNCIFDGIISERMIDFSNLKEIENIHFKNSDLYYCNFINVNMDNIHFLRCCWPMKDRRYRIATEDEPDKLEEIRDFYQGMKRKYKQEHNEAEVSKWHLAEKEVELLLQAQQKRRSFYWLMLWFYRLSSRFGEDAYRALGTLSALVILPLLVLIPAKLAETGLSPTLDLAQVGTVFMDWLRCMPLTKAPGVEEGLAAWKAWLFWLSQLAITAQFALFAFALRNRFRR